MQSKLIEDLKEEHRTIERLLASLLRLSVNATSDDQLTKPVLAQHITLFRQLADTFHHGREEDILFKAMHDTGMPYDRGPLAVMLHEHDAGRKRVTALNAIATAAGPLTESELESLRYHASAFVEILSSHIAKEDGVLYPMAEARLGGDGLAEIDELDRAKVSPEGTDRLQLIDAAERLSASTLSP